MARTTAVAGPSSSAPTDGSRTQIITDSNALEGDDHPDVPDAPVVGVLRLQGGPRNTQRVAWGEDVVDNEGCGRKSSKICCIYHKPRRFDESSSEGSDDSDSESDERPSDDGQARPPDHQCDRSNHGHHHHPRRRKLDPMSQTQEKRCEPNAYERVPGGKGKKKAKP